MTIQDDRPEAPHPRELDQPVRLHALSYLDEGDEVTVGRLDDERAFVVLPADGAELLRRLEQGATPAAVAAWYLSTYGESVDILDFIADLDELGFLASADGPVPAGRPIRWMRLGRLVFSPWGALGYGCLIALFLFEIARDHKLAPSYHNVFFTHYMSVLVLVTFLGQMPLILVHEAAHTLAGRRLGLPSKLSVGRRLYYLVFQTTMDGLVAVPRSKRILPILAGMIADVGVLMGLTLFAAFTRHPHGGVSLPGAIALSLAYLTLFRLLWQCWFFLQTDIYYLVTTVTGCVDLQRVSKHRIANFASRLLGRPARWDPEDWHPRDRSVSRWYSILLVVGYGFSIATLVLGVLPAALKVFSAVLRRFAGHSGGATGVLDSIVFLTITVAELAIALGLAIKDRRRAVS